jgi:DNA-binding NarL/FixJ family response regulator
MKQAHPDKDKLRVGLIEDDKTQRRYWEVLLKGQSYVDSVTTWASAELFFADARHPDMDLMLVDLGLPGEDGLNVVQQLQTTLPNTRTIILTSSTEPSDVFATIRAGASGYLVKQASPEVLLTNLEVVLQNGMTFSPSIAKLVVEQYLTTESNASANAKSFGIETLTERELTVLELIEQFGSAKEAAFHIGLSHETVRVHLKSIYKKLQVNSKTAAVELFQRRVTR